MTYFAYLDEFGHDGPYVSREHTRMCLEVGGN